jgi:tetratricopeptide (TPR) repeat protein
LQEKELLQSWKEISAYLNRNIRTCQYWEKKHGLPVHRLEDSPKARVFAYKKELDSWLKEKLHKGELVKRNILYSFFQKNKILLISVFTFLCVVVITLIVLLFPRKNEVILLPSLKPSVVVMPFSNNTGEKDLDHLSLGLSIMLITDLSQSRYVSIVREDRLFSSLLDLGLLNAQSFSEKDLRDVALELDASHVIQGSYIKIGETFRIDVDVIETQLMRSVGTSKVEELETNLSLLIDELTKRIKSYLNLTDEAFAHDIDERVGKVTTDHPQAYRLYIEGRNLHNRDEYEKSIASMEKALEIDPEFALALRSISESYNNLGLLSKSREYAERALEFRGRFTDRERYHFELLFHSSSEKSWDKAIAAGLSLIQHYPVDIRGNDLANLHFLLEQWEKAIGRYQVFLQNEEISYFPYRGIASSYEAKGMYNKTLEILKNYLHNISDHYSIRWQLAYSHLCQGNYDLALEEAQKLEPWNSDIKAYIYHCMDELDKAEREYLGMLDSRINRDVASACRLLGSLYLLQGRYKDAEKQLLEGVAFTNEIGESSWKHEIHSDLACLYLASGNPEKALEECTLALKYAIDDESIRRQIESLHLMGLIFIDMKLLDEAQRKADELKDLIENWLNEKLIRYYYHLIGNIELDKKNFLKAIVDLKKAIKLLPFQHYEWYFQLPMAHSLFLESLALAYYQSGDSELAQEEYDKIIKLTIGKLWYGDIFSNSFYMLAKIFEQTGQRDKAMKHYEKFLTLLKDADPGIREVDDAKKRLAVLKRRSGIMRNSTQ